LAEAAVEKLPPAFAGPFDAILAVNSLGFWPEKKKRLAINEDPAHRRTPAG
jgi:hypothetical protein